MEKQVKDRLWTKVFIALYACNFIFFFGFYMLQPTLPLYITSIGGNDGDVGTVATAFAVAAVVVRLLITFLLDKFSRKTLLYSGLILSLVMSAAYSFMHSVLGVAVLRVLQGVGFGFVTTFCGSMAADALSDSRRGEGIGLFSMGTTAAVALSPMVGLAIMNGWGFIALFIATAVVLIFSLITINTVKLPEATKPKTQGTEKIKLWNRFYDTRIWYQTILLLLYGIARASQQNYHSLLAVERGLSTLAAYYIIEPATVFVFKFATAKIYDKLGPKATLIPGAIGCIIAMYIYSTVKSDAWFLFSAVMAGIAIGAIIPTFQVWIMNAVGAKNRDLGSALYYNIYDIGIAIGSAIMGVLAMNFGYFGMYRVAMFIMIAFLLAFVIPVACGKKIDR